MILILVSISFNTNLYLRTDLFTHLKYSDCIYITTDEGGLLSFEPRDSTWKSKTIVSGLFSNTINDIAIRNDTVWVITPGGLTIFNRELEFLNSIEFNLLFFNDTNPKTIELYDSRVILGGNTGLQWFDISDFDDLSRVDKINYGFTVFDILPLDSCYILGTSNGIYKTYNFGDSDTIKIENMLNTYTLSLIGSSIWAGGSWGCEDITEDTARFSLHTVRQIEEIDTNIYIATSDGLYMYENNIWISINPGDVRGICKTDYYDFPTFIIRGEGLKNVDWSEFIRPPGLASNKVCDLTQTPDGSIYVSHRDTWKITKFDGKEWEILNRNNEWGIPGRILFNIESDSKGNIYIGVWFDEFPSIPNEEDTILYEWNPKEDSFPHTIHLPVNAKTISGMLVDSNDDLWIGAFFSDISDWIFKMHRVVEKQDSLEWTIYTAPSFKWIRVFTEGKEGIYSGNSPTMGGSGIHILYPDGSIKHITGNLGSSTVSMTVDFEGDIWAGLEDKLLHISEDRVFEVFNSGNSGLIRDKVDGIAFDFQGGMWCYHSGDGISYRDPENNWSSYQGFSYVDADDITYPLYFSSSNKLYIGTYEGLYELDIDFNIPQDSLKYPRTNVYPNPFNSNEHDFLYFSSSELDGKMIYIYDVYGRLEGEYIVNGDYLRVNVDDLKSGLYFYVVKGEDRILDKGRFVVVR